MKVLRQPGAKTRVKPTRSANMYPLAPCKRLKFSWQRLYVVAKINKVLRTKNLYGKNLEELRALASEMSMPRFAAGQMAAWLYKKGATEIAQMTDLSLAAREKLAATGYEIGVTKPLHEEISQDGTRKYLFAPNIESAYIPDGDRATMCVSSQVGCRMGGAFCMTGRQGLARSLSAGEILNQLRFEGLTNVVYMGMGEPLDNLDEVLKSLEILTSDWGFGWSPSRITLSTIGVIPALEEFLRRSKVHLAVSLHNPFSEERAAIMPVEKAWPIAEVVSLLKRHSWDKGQRISFEYILFRGLNDTPAHIRELARLLNGLPARINLIRFHDIPGLQWVSPPPSEMVKFRDALTAKGIITTIRTSRGEDIKAACGLLSTLEPRPKA